MSCDTAYPVMGAGRQLSSTEAVALCSSISTGKHRWKWWAKHGPFTADATFYYTDWTWCLLCFVSLAAKKKELQLRNVEQAQWYQTNLLKGCYLLSNLEFWSGRRVAVNFCWSHSLLHVYHFWLLFLDVGTLKEIVLLATNWFSLDELDVETYWRIS